MMNVYGGSARIADDAEGDCCCDGIMAEFLERDVGNTPDETECRICRR